MKRPPAPDSPDWAAAALGDFLQILRKLAWAAAIAAACITLVALAIALADLRTLTP